MKQIFSIYFFPFLNTYKFQYLGRFGGKTVLRCTYLFRRVHFLDSFLLRGNAVSLESGGKAPVNFCPKILFCSFPGVLATVSTHLITPTTVLKLHSFHGRGTREFGYSFNTSCHTDCYPRTPQSFSQARHGSLATTQHIS